MSDLLKRLRGLAEGEEGCYFGDVALLAKEAADELTARENDIGILIANIEWLAEVCNANLEDEADDTFRQIRKDSHERTRGK